MAGLLSGVLRDGNGDLAEGGNEISLWNYGKTTQMYPTAPEQQSIPEGTATFSFGVVPAGKYWLRVNSSCWCTTTSGTTPQCAPVTVNNAPVSVQATATCAVA